MLCSARRARLFAAWFALMCGLALSAALGAGAARAETESDARFMPLEYVRVGLLLHDVRGREPPLHTRENGGDVNLEAGFLLPLPQRFWIPNLHFGGAVNLAGNTHQLYMGLNWRVDIGRSWFLDGALATVMHTGAVRQDSDVNLQRTRILGCRIIFREALSLGLRLTENSSWLSSVWHISNANLCRHNQGLTGFGFQYQYNF